MNTVQIVGVAFFSCATSLAAICNAQNLPTASELVTPIVKSKYPAATYAVFAGKVLAKKTDFGWVVFNYSGGVLVSEKLPNGVTGTYSYDRQGKFEEIVYSDGQRITAT